MSRLGGFDLVLQIRRDKLLNLMQENGVTVQGNPLVTPFRLAIKGPPVGFPPRPSNTVDLIVSGLDLELEVGSNRCTLLLRLDAGVVRLPGEPEAPFTGGTVKVQLQFVDLVFLTVRPLGATLDAPVTPVIAGIADFAARANREVDRLLDAERNRDVDIYPDPASTSPDPRFIKQLLTFAGNNEVLDAQTLAVHVGTGGGPALTSTLSPETSFSCAVSAARVIANLPTAEAMSRPPMTMTEINYALGDGKVDVTGTFDARDTCWKVSGGKFSQTMVPFMEAGSAVLKPPKDHPKPDLDYEVTMPFLCHFSRAATEIVDSALVTVALLLSGEALARALAIPGFVPADSREERPPGLILTGVTWRDIQISPEGVLLLGDRPGGGVVSAVQHPAIRITTGGSPSNLHVVDRGSVTVQGPTCTPQAFDFVRSAQNDEKRLDVETDWLLEPIEYTWTVNGLELDDEAELIGVDRSARRALQFVGTVTQAMPPPNGTPIFGHATKLGYAARGHSVRLDAREEDANYEVRAEVRAKDALGRTFTDAVNLEFVGDIVDLGDAFEEYMDECVKAADAIVNEKGRKRSKVKPGEPQQRWRVLVDAITERALAGDTEAQAALPSLSRAVGSAIVAKALGRVRTG